MQALNEAQSRANRPDEVPLDKAEVMRREAAVRERESELRKEIRDLEDANDQLSQQTQKQFDEMALLQDHIAKEITDFRKEQEHNDQNAAVLAKVREVNAELVRELGQHKAEIQALRRRGAEEMAASGQQDILRARERSSPAARQRVMSPAPRVLSPSPPQGQRGFVQELPSSKSNGVEASVVRRDVVLMDNRNRGPREAQSPNQQARVIASNPVAMPYVNARRVK